MQSCQRPDCAAYQQTIAGAVRPHYRYGSGGWALLRCNRCGRSFSERRGTPLFRKQLAPHVVFAILESLSRGMSLRTAAAQAGVDKNTVLRVRELGERHARWFQLSMLEQGHAEQEAEQVFTFLRLRRQRRLREPA